MKKYTFEDWVYDRIRGEYDYDGSIIGYSNSQKYMKLAFENKMTYGTLDKIQEAQMQTYHIMINNRLNSLKREHYRQIKHTPDRNKKIESDIRLYERFIAKFQNIHDEVVLPAMHLGIKKGAKFITASQYRFIVLKKGWRADWIQPTDDPNKLIWVDSPFLDEWIYIKMEVAILFLQFLKSQQKKTKSNQEPKPKQDPDKAKVENALSRLELFKQKNPEGLQILKDEDYDELYKLTETFIYKGKYTSPPNKFRPLIDDDVIRSLIQKINNDLYPGDRKKRNFIKFMIDVFKFPSTWNEKYINKHFTDLLHDSNLYIKYGQYLEN